MSVFRILTLLGILVSIAWISACEHQPILKPSTSKNPTNPDEVICFETEILPMLTSGCSRSGCHNTGSRHKAVNSYSAIMASGYINTEESAKSKIIKMLNHTDEDDRMPPPPDPRWSADKIQLLLNWIEQGARNTTSCGAVCDSSRFTYTRVKEILDNYCSGCHSGNSPSGGISLATYAGVKAQADNGQLVGSIRRLSGFSPMPQDGAQLPECEIRIIEKWVASGSPDN